MEYEQKLLALIVQDEKAALKCLELNVKGDIFENPENSAFYRILMHYFSKYKIIPTSETFFKYMVLVQIEDRMKKKLPLVYEEVKGIKVAEPVQFIVDYLTSFWQTRKVKEILKKNLDRITPSHIIESSNDITSEISKIRAVNTDVGTEGDFRFAGQEVMDRYQQAAKGEVAGVQYGFSGLDSRIGGHCAGELFIALGYMKVGKSTFLLNVANNVWHQGKNVVYFSAEVSKKVIDRRLTAMNIEGSITGLKQGSLPKEEYSRLLDFQKTVGTNPASLYVIDQGGMSTDFIASKIRELKNRMKIDLVIVDYLGICRTNNMRSTQKEYEIIGQIAWELRDIAKIEQVPVLTAHQQNKERGISKSLDVGRHCDLMLSLDLKNEEALLNNSELVELEATITLTRDSAAGRFPIEASFSKGIMRQPIMQTARLVDAVRDSNNADVDEELF